MNKIRRKKIKELSDSLGIIMNELETVKSDEEYYYDNIPDNLLGSMRAEDSEEAIEIMDEVIDCLSETINNLSMLF